MKVMKVGVVGCGGIAGGKHIPAIKKIKDVEIAALCDIIVERAHDYNAKFCDGKAKVFEKYQDLIKEDLDAVYVCTPNCSHCEITVAALKSGKHVMCEKPMAMNYREAQEMLKARDESGKLLTIGYQNRYRKDSRYVKKECESGELGDIYFAKAHAIRRRAVPTWGVFIDEEKQGGGPLIDIGTHSLDLTLHFMQNYEPLYCVGTTYHKLNKQKNTANAWGDWDTERFTAEDSAFGFIVMKNGATIVLESSWALNTLEVREASVTLCGDKAGIEMCRDHKLRINGIKNGTQYCLEPNFDAGGVDFFDGSNGGNTNDAEAATFINAVRGKGKLYVKAEEAAVVTRILEGIYESAKTGKPYYFD